MSPVVPATASLLAPRFVEYVAAWMRGVVDDAHRVADLEEPRRRDAMHRPGRQSGPIWIAGGCEAGPVRAHRLCGPCGGARDRGSGEQQRERGAVERAELVGPGRQREAV